MRGGNGVCQGTMSVNVFACPAVWPTSLALIPALQYMTCRRYTHAHMLALTCILSRTPAHPRHIHARGHDPTWRPFIASKTSALLSQAGRACRAMNMALLRGSLRAAFSFEDSRLLRARTRCLLRRPMKMERGGCSHACLQVREVHDMCTRICRRHGVVRQTYTNAGGPRVVPTNRRPDCKAPDGRFPHLLSTCHKPLPPECCCQCCCPPHLLKTSPHDHHHQQPRQIIP